MSVTRRLHAVLAFIVLIAAMAMIAPAGASAITQAELDELVRQARPADMPHTQATPERGDLPRRSAAEPQPTPTPEAPAVAPPADLQPRERTAPEQTTPGLARSRNGTTCTTKAGTKRCVTRSAGRVVRICVTAKRRRTCTSYRSGRATKRCVTARGRTSCKRLSGASVGRRLARASTLAWNGWPSSVSPAVGKIISVTAAGKTSLCSGTVVSRTLVLTAAHCVFGNGGYHRRIVFVPGGTANGQTISPNYGAWEAGNWWAPDAYRNGGDMALDYGLVEIPPSTGGAISDVVGAWNITPGLTWNTGAQVSLMGYPVSGYWATAQGLFGNGQYACNGRWDEGYSRIGSGYELWTSCTMNGGASGGPWFVKLSDGSWTIGGVNSQCYAPNMDPQTYCTPYSSHLRTPYLDNRFFDFWNSVNAQRRH